MGAGSRGVWSTEYTKASETEGGDKGFLICRPTDDGGRQSELWDSEGRRFPTSPGGRTKDLELKSTQQRAERCNHIRTPNIGRHKICMINNEVF